MFGLSMIYASVGKERLGALTFVPLSIFRVFFREAALDRVDPFSVGSIGASGFWLLTWLQAAILMSRQSTLLFSQNLISGCFFTCCFGELSHFRCFVRATSCEFLALGLFRDAEHFCLETILSCDCPRYRFPVYLGEDPAPSCLS